MSRKRESNRLRAGCVLLLAMLGMGALCCSEEHETPVAFHETLLDKPIDLEAELESQRIVVTWSIADDTNVTGYAVSVSDSTGLVRESLVTGTTYTIQLSSLMAAGRGDSTWFYFQVSAVDENLFRGPASAVDSVQVF
ncbi:MAG: fibronectin type III domain-containing protein [Chloroflexi bacterium]|nr:fibronectin type III domain-containing protein [Chloroflexota bacterium]